jgi:hypothetical protein
LNTICTVYYVQKSLRQHQGSLPEHKGNVELVFVVAGEEGTKVVLHTSVASHEVHHAECYIWAPSAASQQLENKQELGNRKFQVLNGREARDFRPLVFSTNQPHIVLTFTPKNILECCFELAEIFIFESCSPGFASLQNFVPRGLILRRTLLGGVSGPAGPGISDSAEQASAIKCTYLCHCSAGSDTPQDLVPQGLIPHTGFLSAGYLTPLAN